MLRTSGCPYKVTEEPVPALRRGALPSAEVLTLVLLVHDSEAPPLAVRVSAIGPGATSAVEPNPSATEAPGVVVTAVGTVRLAVALAPGV